MTPSKQIFQESLRRLRILGAADWIRCQLQCLRLFARNQAVRRNQPDFPFPPAALLYEIGGRLDLGTYREEGKKSAGFLAKHFAKFSSVPPSAVLDWGCGVSCVCRHLPEILPVDCRIVGCDINSRMVDWGKLHIAGVEYFHTGLKPPLPLAPGSVDWIYALSVFTHLEQATVELWLNEMKRVLSPSGTFVFTTNGSRIEPALLPEERDLYFRDGFAVRSGIAEGRKMFLAFHEPRALRKQLEKCWDVLDCSYGGMVITGQDMWTIRPKQVQ